MAVATPLRGGPLSPPADAYDNDPVRAARDEFAAEEWRRLVDLEKQRIRRRRSLWFWIKNLVMRRVRVTVEWRDPR